MNLYYSIWTDCIKRMLDIGVSKNDLKRRALFFMSLAMTFNFVLVMVIFQLNFFGYYFYEINLSFLSGFANYAVTMLVLYFLPCFIINYLFIFRNNRYEKLLDKYKYYNGKLCLAYYLISLFLPPFLILIGMLWAL